MKPYNPTKEEVEELLCKFGIEANTVFFLNEAIHRLDGADQLSFYTPVKSNKFVEPTFVDRVEEVHNGEQAFEEYMTNHYDYLRMEPRYWSIKQAN